MRFTNLALIPYMEYSTYHVIKHKIAHSSRDLATRTDQIAIVLYAKQVWSTRPKGK